MQIKTQIKVAAAADKAWEILAENFGNVAEWISVLESSSMQGVPGVGAIRVCNTKGVGLFPAASIEEQLTVFDAEQRRFTYRVEKGLPPIFKGAQNAWRIDVIDDDHCVIHSHADIELRVWAKPFAPLFSWLIKRDLGHVFEEMEHYIETGKVHQRKMQSPLNPARL